MLRGQTLGSRCVQSPQQSTPAENRTHRFTTTQRPLVSPTPHVLQHSQALFACLASRIIPFRFDTLSQIASHEHSFVYTAFRSDQGSLETDGTTTGSRLALPVS